MTGFCPFPGYDPMDGEEPHVELAPDNPVAAALLPDRLPYQPDPETLLPVSQAEAEARGWL